MKVLITGIDGFVGSHLAEELVSNPGIRLSGIVERGSKLLNIGSIAASLDIHECDICDPAAVENVIKDSKPDIIYHLAGQAFVPFSLRDPRHTFSVNINGGINILEAARKHVPGAFLLVVSSGEVYGAVEKKNLPIDESFLLNPSNPYAASKACIDLIAQQYRKSFRMNIVVARPFNHLGPRQSELFVGSAFAKQVAEIKLKKREPKIFVGNLDPRRDFTDVRDVVRAYILISDKPEKYGVYNICSGKPTAIREILDALCELSGIKVGIVSDPERRRADEIPEIVGSPERLQSSTGWKPVHDLKETLGLLIEFWEDKLRNTP